MLKGLFVTITLLLLASSASSQLHLIDVKLNSREFWQRSMLASEEFTAQKRVNAVQETLDFYLNIPLEKRESFYDQVVASQRADVAKFTAQLQKAQDDLATFDQLIMDPAARKVWNERVKEDSKRQAKAAQSGYRGYRSLSVTIVCTSTHGRDYSRTRCTVY